MDFREIRWEDMDWMHLAQDRDKWHVNEPSVYIKCGHGVS